MGKPSTLYSWATTANYTGGPANGTPTRTAPTSGPGSQQSEGLRPGDELGAQLLGALFGNIFDWLAYVTANQIDGSLVIGGAALSFTPIAFTATSGSPGSLTATAHGLQTGDGPVLATNSGGGLPGGLINGESYWVIRVDANTFRLATSVADAIATTPVVITSNGTGTQTLSPGTSPTRLGDETVSRGLTVAGTTSIGRKLTVGGQALSVPAFVFTADSTTDKLTFTDHGLLNGDGPIQVSNSGGALPAGLAAATNYWVIFVDSANIKLATSYANAVAGVAIDLTTNGTGTQTLACTVSTTRPADTEVTGGLTVDGETTAAPGSSFHVSSGGGYRHDTLTLSLHGSAFVNVSGLGTVSFDATGSILTNCNGIAPLPLVRGRRVTAVRVGIFDSSGTTHQLRFSGTDGTLVIGDTSLGNATEQILTVAVTHTVAASAAYSLLLQKTGGTGTIDAHWIEIDYDFL